MESIGSKIENINLAIQQAEEVIKELDDEQNIVSQYAARFASFLKHNSIVLHNKSYEEYLNMMIKNAELIAESTENDSIVKNLKKVLEEYVENKNFLDQQFKKANVSDSSSVCQLNVGDVIAMREVLFKLKWNGPTLKNIFDKELTHPMVFFLKTRMRKIMSFLVPTYEYSHATNDYTAKKEV